MTCRTSGTTGIRTEFDTTLKSGKAPGFPAFSLTEKGEAMDLSLVWMLVVEFFLFSCLGWAMEVTLKYIQYHRFINRGFLIGPYCPIYGWGVVTVTLVVGGLAVRRGTLGETFLAGMVLCGALEYFTSWYMEKWFHARWWDYSQKPMNLHGRIWIGNLLLFGVACVVIVHVIDPLLFDWLEHWRPWILRLTALCILALLAADYIASHFLMGVVRREIDSQTGDNTEEISRQVHAMLHDRNLLIRRIHQAYPDLQARPRRLTQQLREARSLYKQAVKRVNQALKELTRNTRADLRADLELALHQAVAARKEARARLREIQRKFIVRRADGDDD